MCCLLVVWQHIVCLVCAPPSLQVVDTLRLALPAPPFTQTHHEHYCIKEDQQLHRWLHHHSTINSNTVPSSRLRLCVCDAPAASCKSRATTTSQPQKQLLLTRLLLCAGASPEASTLLVLQDTNRYTNSRGGSRAQTSRQAGASVSRDMCVGLSCERAGCCSYSHTSVMQRCPLLHTLPPSQLLLLQQLLLLNP